MVSKVWVGISVNNIYLLQFKIQGYLQKQSLITGVSKLISKKKLIFVPFQSTFCFVIKILLNCHPKYFGVSDCVWGVYVCVCDKTKNAFQNC